ncbi:MAG: hypothetical protein ACRDRN_05445 [Sciscionella sp.]
MTRFLHSPAGLCVAGMVALGIASIFCALRAGYDLHGLAQAVAGTSGLE